MSEQKPAPSGGSWLLQWATLLAGVSLVLVVVNIALAVMDQSAQAEANQRQQQIAQAAQLQAVSNLLTQALSRQEQSSKDPQLKELLARAGVGTETAPVGTPAVPAAAPSAAKP